MAIQTLTLYTGEVPLIGQTQAQFDTNTGNILVYLKNFGDDLNARVGEVNADFTQINNWYTSIDAINTNVNTKNDNVNAKSTNVDDKSAIVDTKHAETVTNATQAQLDKWIAEAHKKTAESYSNEPQDVEVKVYTSNGDGTFTATAQTGVFSALHERITATAITATSLDANSDVDTSGKQEGDELRLQGGLWKPYTPPPVAIVTLTGVSTGQELANNIVITDTAFVANETIQRAEITNGSVVNNNDGTFTVTLPDYSVATSVTLTVFSERAGYEDGSATHVINVTNTQVTQPDFTGSPTEGTEQTTVVLTNTEHEGTATYFPSVNFGSYVDNGDGTYDVTLPLQTTSATVTFSIYGTRTNDIDSATTNHVITVNSVGFVTDDPIVDTLTTFALNDGFN